MSPSIPLILLSTALLLFSTAAATNNITRILERYPDFSQFYSLLAQNNLVAEINRRHAVTVLALTNDRVGEIAAKPEDVQKRVLSTHVILDYYDILKLNKLKNTKTVLTTLYQSTGVADDRQGFIDVIHKVDGSIVFGSAVQGAAHDAMLEGSVASQPYNISVLSISKPIIAPGIDGSNKPFSPPPPEAAAAPASKVPPPAAAESPEELLIDAPAEAPAEVLADGPSADAEDQEKLSTPDNAAEKNMISGVLVVAMLSLLSIH